MYAATVFPPEVWQHCFHTGVLDVEDAAALACVSRAFHALVHRRLGWHALRVWQRVDASGTPGSERTLARVLGFLRLSQLCAACFNSDVHAPSGWLRHSSTWYAYPLCLSCFVARHPEEVVTHLPLLEKTVEHYPPCAPGGLYHVLDVLAHCRAHGAADLGEEELRAVYELGPGFRRLTAARFFLGLRSLA